VKTKKGDLKNYLHTYSQAQMNSNYRMIFKNMIDMIIR